MNTVETPHAAAKTNGTESQLVHPSMLMMAHTDAAPKGPPGLSATPTMSGLLQALRRRWLSAVGLALVASAVTVAAVFVILPPKFNVAMQVRVAKQPGVDDTNHIIFTANMEALIKSPLVLSAALNEKTADGKDVKDLELIRTKGMGAVEWLAKTLKTDYKLGPEVLRVTLPADSAEEAAEILNAIAKAFFNEYADMERSKKQARLAELRAKKTAIEDQLSRDRKYFIDQIKHGDHKDLVAATGAYQTMMRRLDVAEAIRRNNEEEYIKAFNEKSITEIRMKNLDKQEVPDDVLAELFSKDLSIQAFIKRILDIEDEISRIYREFNEPLASQKAVPLKHAKIEVRDQKEAREAQLKPGFERIWRQTEAKALKHLIELAELRSEEFKRRRGPLLEEITDLERKVKEAAPGGKNLPPALQTTEDKIKLAEVALSQTGQKITEVELETPGSRIMPLDRAKAPLERDRSQQTKMAGAGGFGMFALALFGVAFLEFRSRKIGAADDVSEGLGLKVIGTVPAMPARSKKQAPDSAVEQLWHNQLHESMDAIRTVILHQARSEALHILMVTSASSGEGKTTLATQLAASLARAWKRVLVIDGSLRSPATHALFDVPQEPGLSEVLRGEVEPGDAIRATQFSRLWVLPAGNGDLHAIQALAQDNVRTLFEQLKQQYDFIVIDAPAILPVTDSLLLGQHVDAVLFAVLRDVSRAPAIHAAQQKMATLGVPTLGAVVLGAESEFNDKNFRFAKTN